VTSEARIALYAFFVICLIFAGRQVMSSPVAANGVVAKGGQPVGAQQLAATFRFAAKSGAAEQSVFLAAVAAARPEAQRLVAIVDGLVTVHFEHPPGSPIGLTRFDGTDYDVTIDLAAVTAQYGAREASAIVLHELGHVVDVALVNDKLRNELDGAIPTGESCLRGGLPTGACASVQERFADTFSKWAMDDLGVNLASGYRILPPVPLETWGRPLGALVS